MKHKEFNRPEVEKNYIYPFYLVTILFITLSGFGQMPIFKRYYIADIPGLGWLAKYLITHYIHYVGAVVLLALVAYQIADYLLLTKKKLKVSLSGLVRGGLILGIILTGLLLVIRNTQANPFSLNFIIFLDLSHLTLVLLFLMTSLYCLLLKKKWTIRR